MVSLISDLCRIYARPDAGSRLIDPYDDALRQIEAHRSI
jgi:hypothetical protein